MFFIMIKSLNGDDVSKVRLELVEFDRKPALEAMNELFSREGLLDGGRQAKLVFVGYSEKLPPITMNVDSILFGEAISLICEATRCRLEVIGPYWIVRQAGFDNWDDLTRIMHVNNRSAFFGIDFKDSNSVSTIEEKAKELIGDDLAGLTLKALGNDAIILRGPRAKVELVEALLKVSSSGFEVRKESVR